MKKLILVAVIIALLGLLGLPGWLGQLAQNEIETQLELTSNNPVMAVTIAEYDRGWFSSRVRYEAGFTDEYLEMIESAVADDDNNNDKTLDESLLELLSPFEMVSDISHGPIGLLDGPFLGLYRSITTESENNPKLNEFLTQAKMPHLVKGKSTTSLLGNTAFSFEIPASANTGQNDGGNSPEASLASKLIFSGATGEGNYSALGGDGGHIELSARLDELAIKDDQSEFSLTALTTAADSSLVSQTMGIGTASMSVGSIMLSDRSNDEPVNLAMQDLTVASDIKHGESKETLNMQISYRAGEIAIAEESVSDIELKVTLDEVSALGFEQYNELMQDFATVQALEPKEQQQLLAKATAIAHEFLSKSPTISFDPIKLTASGEQLLANLAIKLNGSNLPAIDAFDALDPALWLQMVSGKAGLTLSENMATLIAVTGTQSQLQAALGDQQEIPPEQISQMAAAQAPIMIETLVQQGMLLRSDDTISAALNYENGELLLNEQPFPLGAMLGL